jgi:SAM-dependent methyltransferase
VSTYAFGDSDVARERLGIVAATFEGPTRQLLADVPPYQPRYVLDMGCGPGYTSALLRTRFPHSEVTGLDVSAAMVDEARTRVPGAWFAVADVTEPLRLPADVVYARLLLGHLADPAAVLHRWVAAMRPPGFLVCEEPVRYRSDDELFRRYEAVVTAVVAKRGGTLWAAPVLDRDPPATALTGSSTRKACRLSRVRRNAWPWRRGADAADLIGEAAQPQRRSHAQDVELRQII